MQNSIAREVTFEDQSGDAPIALELDMAPRHTPTFVTGAVAAARADATSAHDACAYCGALDWVRDGAGERCAHCGAPARAAGATPVVVSPWQSPQAPSSSLAPPAASSSPSARDGILDAIADIPFGFWKRLPVYAFLGLVLGNGCRCGGLSAMTNLALALLVAIGIAGVVVSVQRNP